jgi:tRNA (guanine37-N1)-methyltransferase
VVTGGELPALLVADAVARLLPGVLKCEESYTEESHFSGLLEYPQYTRPPVFLGREVPEVLRGGHHAKIMKWHREQALKRTLSRRPDMLGTADLSDKDRNYLDALVRDRKSKA